MIIIRQGFLYLKSYFHLCLKNKLSAMHVDWDPPHLSLVACYILHCMQELIKQGMGQELEKSCVRCKKNTWHINNNLTKDRSSIPMHMTVVLGLHKFSLQATIDHHGPSIYSGHYTASIGCCKRTFYCNDSKITELEMIDTKNSSTAYVVMYELITWWFSD